MCIQEKLWWEEVKLNNLQVVINKDCLEQVSERPGQLNKDAGGWLLALAQNTS